ncbi:hypothetical protein L0B52_05530 [Suttonella sp. R2A3]|nr:glycosyltransferase [Suttonella sp. R2A3]UJF23811.1 hypothetical protein L0B52_05530 [Suttonella sp. R2A3]
MKILHVLPTKLPVPPQGYGGTERVLWSLIEGQRERGHSVRFLTKNKNQNDSRSIAWDDNKSIAQQVEGWADVIHFHFPFDGALRTPFICTEHGNCNEDKTYPQNSVFLSRKHADLYHGQCYVHNGLQWSMYGEPNIDRPDDYVHFLAKASWRVKNLQGGVRIAKAANKSLHVLGESGITSSAILISIFHLNCIFIIWWVVRKRTA